MKILTVLTYYRPHTSGLTIYAERLAKAFVKRGHEVTVMTTQYDADLPLEEMVDGVRVVRVPVAFRVSKGVIAPTFGLVATKLVFEHDVVQLHLPQFDAPGVAFRARLFGKPSVLTYHCDLNLPTGFFNKIVNSVVHFQNNMAGILANRIVTYTQDYADHSPYLSRYKKKLRTFLPPVELPEAGEDAISDFAKKYKIAENNPVIGMATRLAAEKGVEVLLDAMPAILEKHPKAQVLFAGQYKEVFSEEAYAEQLMARIKEYEKSGHWTFLGILNPEEMAAFYPALDALVVPSLNATEAFGLVQIEAMLNNIPCVASALPGVRQPVLMHEMGEVAAIGSANELAEGLLKIFADKEKYRCDTVALAKTYDPDSVAVVYEKMFKELGVR
ncbi:MAG: glycosyltransferase family 4 protein [Anaerolineae bacterium]|jgi:glycosyltransferase involved in cell wall biosynthesis|nr:glycosyltransferase family 4 protein [Anaerolineae bacterium]MBT7073575.1 glycosyltransferase family 4 protein [Anaerolineae bacterium]MBT7782129.1 glycosyltransferase family 4 protein [Anaerolineae bacterium]